MSEGFEVPLRAFVVLDSSVPLGGAVGRWGCSGEVGVGPRDLVLSVDVGLPLVIDLSSPPIDCW